MSQPQTLSHALTLAREALAPHSDTAALDAQTLLAHLTGQSRAWVLAHPEAQLTADQTQRLIEAVERLRRGEPLPYVLGEWAFFGRFFFVTPAVLIPRPETELLIETALAWLQHRSTPARVVDVGTGSGVIAVTLAVERPDLTVVATDRSHAALRVARSNARRHSVAERLRWVRGDLLAPFHGPWDLVCANLPYIPSARLAHLRVARYEPWRALDGGPDGLRPRCRLLAQARRQMAPQGALLLEIGADQGRAATQIAQQTFPQAEVQVRQDLAGHDRLLVIQLP